MVEASGILRVAFVRTYSVQWVGGECAATPCGLDAVEPLSMAPGTYGRWIDHKPLRRTDSDCSHTGLKSRNRRRFLIVEVMPEHAVVDSGDSQRAYRVFTTLILGPRARTVDAVLEFEPVESANPGFGVYPPWTAIDNWMVHIEGSTQTIRNYVTENVQRQWPSCWPFEIEPISETIPFASFGTIVWRRSPSDDLATVGLAAKSGAGDAVRLRRSQIEVWAKDIEATKRGYLAFASLASRRIVLHYRLVTMVNDLTAVSPDGDPMDSIARLKLELLLVREERSPVGYLASDYPQTMLEMASALSEGPESAAMLDSNIADAQDLVLARYRRIESLRRRASARAISALGVVLSLVTALAIEDPTPLGYAVSGISLFFFSALWFLSRAPHRRPPPW